MLSSRLHETCGHELEHQYLHWNINILFQMAQARPGPAQAWPGPDLGNLETWKSRNLESQKISKMKILKFQINVAQNDGKVWISRKKRFQAPFGGIPGHFSMDPKNDKNVIFLSIFLGGPKGPIHPVWGCAGVNLLDSQSRVIRVKSAFCLSTKPKGKLCALPKSSLSTQCM